MFLIMGIVALLPIKAYSERIESKNFRLFNEKPLFRWVLDSLFEVENIEQVVINTDAVEILDNKSLRTDDRVVIRARSPELCGDSININKVLADDISNIPAELYVMTHVTNPLLRSDTIKIMLNEFEKEKKKKNIDSLFTVNKFQSRFYNSEVEPINHDPAFLMRTQDMQPLFEENSMFYIFTSDSFKKTGSRIGEAPMMYETPSISSFDIDTPDDWSICEIISKHITSSKS